MKTMHSGKPRTDDEDRFAILSYATRLLASQTDHDEVLYIALDTLCSFSHSDKIAIIQSDKKDSHKTGKIIGLLKNGEVSFPGNSVRIDSPPFEKVIKNKKPGIYTTSKGSPTLCLPILDIQLNTVGLVAIDRDSSEPLPMLEMQILVMLSTLIGVSLEQSHYFRLATFDGLTDLFVRRYFDIRLTEEMARVQRHGGELSLMMIDIDNFKQINDTHGHQQGDTVLKELATILRYSIRKNIDVACRYGGEEFITILPNTGLNGARVVAERFRQNCEDFPFAGKDGTIKVTISGGIAAIDKESELTAEQFLKRADTVLYEAKAAGRNRIVEWEAARDLTSQNS